MRKTNQSLISSDEQEQNQRKLSFQEQLLLSFRWRFGEVKLKLASSAYQETAHAEEDDGGREVSYAPTRAKTWP